MRKVLAMMLVLGCSSEAEERAEMNKAMNEIDTEVSARVALDAMKQFDIVFKRGDKMEICVHAGIVAAAMLQTKDEKRYNEWKDMEKKLCKRAGL